MKQAELNKVAKEYQAEYAIYDYGTPIAALDRSKEILLPLFDLIPGHIT